MLLNKIKNKKLLNSQREWSGENLLPEPISGTVARRPRSHVIVTIESQPLLFWGGGVQGGGPAVFSLCRVFPH